MKDQRTERIGLRVKPAIKARVEAAAQQRGQPLSVWFERLVEAALPLETQDAENAQ